MASRKSSLNAPRLYGAQMLADICEVDLKTVHHWAERGKIAHHRTEGRHLRFRRNDVVKFLRGHGYPLPASITRARPIAALALAAAPERSPLTLDELAKRLASRFSTRRFPSAVAALAHLVAEEPDVLVLDGSDATLSVRHAVVALKSDPATSWIALAVVGGDEPLAEAMREAGADVALAAADAARLAPELSRALAVT
ncbi:MAG: helix-turn-helix domain-containing protein [Deltaproteobacteria bacterium]|nr:helix-turn-helix domain-containing protein [Deltaproteobacteria bacterium]